MKILVCGSRSWIDAKAIADELCKFSRQDILIHGGCIGADSIAEKWWRAKGRTSIVFMADWSKHGRAAGPIRNQKMIDSKPDLVLAFNLNESKGTNDTISRAINASIRTLVIRRTTEGCK